MADVCKKNNGFKDLMDMVNSSLNKNTISNFQQNLKSKLSQSSKEVISSLRKDKLRSIEQMLKIDKSQIIMANKKNYIYSSTGTDRMTIIDKNMWGEPTLVTIKERNKVSVRAIKFFEDKPFIFPVFDERNVVGKIIHMDNREIWYDSENLVTIVMFKGNAAQFLPIKIDKTRINSKQALFNYINNYKILYCNRKLNDILCSKNIDPDNVITLKEHYAIIQETVASENIENTTNSDNAIYKILIFDEQKNLYDEIDLRSLPLLSENALDVLFSPEIIQYIRTNNYSIENFKQNGDFIEYWQNMSNKNICVLRYKVN